MAGNVARVGDPISCGDYIATGSSNVFANGMPIALEQESLPQTIGHGCYPPTYLEKTGETTVFVNNLPVAIRGKTLIRLHHCGRRWHVGTVVGDASPLADGGVSVEA